MNPALWAAKTGLDAQQTRMTVTSNNLANVNTNGYKKGRAVFEDLLYQNVRQVGAATSQRARSGRAGAPATVAPEVRRPSSEIPTTDTAVSSHIQSMPAATA